MTTPFTLRYGSDSSQMQIYVIQYPANNSRVDREGLHVMWICQKVYDMSTWFLKRVEEMKMKVILLSQLCKNYSAHLYVLS